LLVINARLEGSRPGIATADDEFLVWIPVIGG